ncbi:uncharacterized protein LOC117922477 [Vitis riparia]|uniref:uncharacterized protein LOC117922477 n=1 Tax=Vitis riparia TaxID=96939 RepID=UPI00155ABCB1|nr:uncharacterized protein LOC117922477 [Vitis riparia]
MEKCSSNLSFVSMYHHHLLLLLIVSFLISSVKASSAVQLMDNSTQDPMCEFVDCGEGRCIASNGVLGFDCECNPGWKKIRIGPLTFPSCVVPNCTLDLQCGKGVSSPPPSPTPASLLPPSFNLLDRFIVRYKATLEQAARALALDSIPHHHPVFQDQFESQIAGVVFRHSPWWH